MLLSHVLCFLQAGHARVLRFLRGNMLRVCSLSVADIVVMETDMPPASHGDVTRLLSSMRPGARLVTYANLRSLWATADLPFRQLPVNEPTSDRC